MNTLIIDLFMSLIEISPHSLQKLTPPPLRQVENFAKPLQFYFRPQYFGIDELDDAKPAMYVTNHTVYGLTDGFLFGVELYKRRGIFLRALVDNMHFEIPGWRDLITKIGFVKASRENCSALMQAGENVLVFPGGMREMCKHKGETYQLVWKDHLGFARMAIQYGYDVIPVAQVGGDDAFDIRFDADDIMQSWLGKYIRNSSFVKKYLHGGENIPPITTGLFGITPIPKPVKLYISFGERIDTSRYLHRFDDEDNLWNLRSEVELAMSRQFITLLEYRKHDKKGLLSLFG
ncbi:MAG TPA: lysophospholipid acyltransferase family protein [Chitinophagales bacterium]|nr:lysophospholipid acyltransferase family protein [Chitinophagales bacterium]